MVYSDFTRKEVTGRFQLHMEEKPDMGSEVPEGEVPHDLLPARGGFGERVQALRLAVSGGLL